ncbi:SAM-dependent methyltransferase [Wenzhouxiangella sp. AB-CW3]|uniref:tRNA (guanine(46)-N(7))-methyltransferase TrmB n=1 Tax=Wenzhouxiangella sp. AB-CW3 TaxID=2771012 RepID=UPI00168AEDBD|nr:methyltransferase domain-containing protein [Wenzhouxiangella sp. AB-CW3]QOC23326.1 SAM-dependent methyltransferase [Wenzhouxiangella sp. AB-CW3]
MPVSRIPETSQTGLHRRLDDVVMRHLASGWRQPLRSHSVQAFESVLARLQAAPALVLDSGCGTGSSTGILARRHPDALVVGIDKSSARLARAPELPDNALLLRAELADFWRLLIRDGLRPVRHYLLYPNPWPKPAHLKRRWHAHPVFPNLLALGGWLELRTNFETYAYEFARALALAGVSDVEVVSLAIDEPISPFERKYADSRHRLCKLTVNLGVTR